MNVIRKSKRSEFFHSLDLIWLANPVRTAHNDVGGAILLVCAFGMLAKIAQSLLTN